MLTFIQWQQIKLVDFQDRLQKTFNDYQRCCQHQSFYNFGFQLFNMDLLSLDTKLNPMINSCRGPFTPFLQRLNRMNNLIKNQHHLPPLNQSMQEFERLKKQLLRVLTDYQWFLTYLQHQKQAVLQIVMANVCADYIDSKIMTWQLLTKSITVRDHQYTAGGFDLNYLINF